MKRNKSLLLPFLLFLTLMLFSCDHIELEERPVLKRVKVEIGFDWSDDPMADPAEMTVYFFRLDGNDNRVRQGRSGIKYTFDFNGKDGGEVILPVGTYAAICHNADSERHGFTGFDDFDEFGLRLIDYDFDSKRNESEERKAHCPDRIWFASIENVAIEDADNQTGLTEPQKVVFKMINPIQKLTFIIRHPINFTPSTLLNATVTGMAGTVHPGRFETGDETVSHLFSMRHDGTGSLRGQITTFGHCSRRPIGTRNSNEESGLHFLHLSDGKGWKSVHDVTSLMHEWEDGEELIIELDTVVLPENTIYSDEGLSPVVGGWEGFHETIGM